MSHHVINSLSVSSSATLRCPERTGGWVGGCVPPVLHSYFFTTPPVSTCLIDATCRVHGICNWSTQEPPSRDPLGPASCKGLKGTGTLLPTPEAEGEDKRRGTSAFALYSSLPRPEPGRTSPHAAVLETPNSHHRQEHKFVILKVLKGLPKPSPQGELKVHLFRNQRLRPWPQWNLMSMGQALAVNMREIIRPNGTSIPVLAIDLHRSTLHPPIQGHLITCPP